MHTHTLYTLTHIHVHTHTQVPHTYACLRTMYTHTHSILSFSLSPLSLSFSLSLTHTNTCTHTHTLTHTHIHTHTHTHACVRISFAQVISCTHFTGKATRQIIGTTRHAYRGMQEALFQSISPEHTSMTWYCLHWVIGSFSCSKLHVLASVIT